MTRLESDQTDEDTGGVSVTETVRLQVERVTLSNSVHVPTTQVVLVFEKHWMFKKLSHQRVFMTHWNLPRHWLCRFRYNWNTLFHFHLHCVPATFSSQMTELDSQRTVAGKPIRWVDIWNSNMTHGLALIWNRKQCVNREDDTEALKTLHVIYGRVGHSDNFRSDALQVHKSVKQAESSLYVEGNLPRGGSSGLER